MRNGLIEKQLPVEELASIVASRSPGPFPRRPFFPPEHPHQFVVLVVESESPLL